MNSEDLQKNLLFLNRQDFGNDFFWGMSASNVHCSNKVIDAPFFLNNNDPFSAVDESFYETELAKYRQDIELIKKTGITNFRFSLSWSRILPDGIEKINEEAIAFYNQILDICAENEVQPFVSLYDSCLPAELKKNGGWTNREILNWFENYVSICVQAFKGKVNHWVVFNDPSVFTGAINFLEMYPSGKNSVNNFLSAIHHTLLCQSIGLKKIKEIENRAQVGTFFLCNYSVPITYSEKDLKAAERIDALLNRLFIEPSLGLGYPIETLPFLKSISKYRITGDDELIKVDFDFIGLQNCTREIVSHNLFVPYLNAKILQYDKIRVKKDHLSPEIHHELIYLIIKKYSKYVGVKKIFVNEIMTSYPIQNDLNVVAHSIKKNPIQSYLQQILLANKSGGKVHGFFVSTSKEMMIQ